MKQVIHYKNFSDYDVISEKGLVRNSYGDWEECVIYRSRENGYLRNFLLYAATKLVLKLSGGYIFVRETQNFNKSFKEIK